MSRSVEFGISEIHQAISPAFLKSLQVFHFAFALGVLIFFFVVLFFFIESTAVMVADNEQVIELLTFAHAVYAVGAYAAAIFAHRTIITRGLHEAMHLRHAARVLAAIRMASIVRLVILEGVAFFGLVILFLGTQTGVLQMVPLYWINLFSTVLLLSFVGLNFPSRERIETLLSVRLGRVTG